MRLPDRAVQWTLCFVLLALVQVSEVSTAVTYDDQSVVPSEDDYSDQKLRSFYSPYMLHHYRYLGGRYFAQSYNGTSAEVRAIMMKWLLGLSGAVIFFVIGAALCACRKGIKGYYDRASRRLHKRWADRYAIDRRAILKDVDDDQFSSSDARVTLDRIVYRAAPSKKGDSAGATGPDYAPLPPGSPVADRAPPVLENGPVPTPDNGEA